MHQLTAPLCAAAPWLGTTDLRLDCLNEIFTKGAQKKSKILRGFGLCQSLKKFAKVFRLAAGAAKKVRQIHYTDLIWLLWRWRQSCKVWLINARKTQICEKTAKLSKILNMMKYLAKVSYWPSSYKHSLKVRILLLFHWCEKM